MNIDIPKGVQTFNTEESFQVKYLENKIAQTFKQWGYDRILLPTIEYYDVHKKGLGKYLINKTFRLIDRTDGEIITLRADYTSQIARYIASLRKKEFPIRYYYSGIIYRYESPKADKTWEIRQTGIELIGSNFLEADAEVIAIASNVIHDLGIDNFQIDLNNIKLFNAIKKILKLDENRFNKFMEHIKNREIYYLKGFLRDFDIDETLKEFITNIPKLQGDINFIKQLKNKMSNYPEIQNVFDEFIKIYNILEHYQLNEKVFFDLGEPKEFSYYTGIVFEIFIKDFKKPIGQGGRYDDLLGKYNGDYPATGFAFDILSLWKYLVEKNLIQEKNKKDFYIIDITQDKDNAYLIAKELRKKGYSVARDITEREVNESIKFAFDNGFRQVIVIGIDSIPDSIYIYTDLEHFQKKKINNFLKEL